MPQPAQWYTAHWWSSASRLATACDILVGRPHALKGGLSQKSCLASSVSEWRYPFLRHTHLLIGPGSLLSYLNSALPSFVRPSLGCGRIVCQRYGRSIEDCCATRPPRPYVTHYPRMRSAIPRPLDGVLTSLLSRLGLAFARSFTRVKEYVHKGMSPGS